VLQDPRKPSPSQLDSSQRLYDGNLVIALVSQTSFVIANTLMAHYARWVEFLGGDLSQVGWIMGAGAAASLVLRPWIALWINKIGAKLSWGIGYAVFSSAAFTNLVIDDLGPLILVARGANVLGAAIVFASSLTYISQIAPERRRTEAIGILGVGGFIGMLIGPVLGDLFLGGELRERADFVNLFIVAGLANILSVVLLCCLRAPRVAQTQTSLRISQFVSTIRQHWPGRILLVDMAFGVCMTVPFVFVASFIDDVPISMLGVSEIGVFFWCYAGAGILFRVLLRRLPERVGARRVLVFGLMFMSVGMFSFCLVGESRPWLVMIPALLTGVGHSLMFHTMTSITIETFPHDVRGTGSALALMMLDLGTFVGAPILGLVGEYLGYSALFSCIGLFTLLSAVVYARPL
jgi:MFS family permease